MEFQEELLSLLAKKGLPREDIFSVMLVLTKKEKADEMIAFLSQLTHCIAVTLMTCTDCEELVDYTGDSFRFARSDPRKGRKDCLWGKCLTKKTSFVIMRKTVEQEEYFFENAFAESRRRWNCGRQHPGEWTFEGGPKIAVGADGIARYSKRV